MRTTGRLTTIPLVVLLLAVAMSPGASAQDPSGPAPSAMCSVLDAQEITDAFGVEVAVADADDLECRYETSGAAGETLLVYVSRSDDTLDDHRGFFEGEDIEVAGAPALFVPGVFSRELYVTTPDGGTFTLQVVGSIDDTVDIQAAMTGLATVAMSRLGGIGPLPTATPPAPIPSFDDAPELEALFPTQIGGLDLTVQSLSGAALTEGSDVPPELQAALAAVGKTIADVRVGIGFAIDPTGATPDWRVSAFQVQGTDMRALKPSLLPLVFEGQPIGAETPQQIGGKDVTSTDIEGTTTYLYPRDDVLWVVTGVEPQLTEIFQNLP